MSLTNEDKDWINAQLERAAAEAAAQLERVETTLLTEFHKWAGPNRNAPEKPYGRAARALDVELEAVSERVTRLQPPAH
jgi:hypothetical protein